MSPEEIQAEALARWLEEHPGQEPPADVDPDVLEAVYALRPDLAPAPRVSAEDILAGVTSGPLAVVFDSADASADADGTLDADAPQAVVFDSADASAAPSRSDLAEDTPVPRAANRPLGWLLGGGVVTLLAAAAALLLFLPVVLQVDGPSQDRFAELQEAPPSAAPTAEPADEAVASADAPEAESEPAAPARERSRDIPLDIIRGADDTVARRDASDRPAGGSSSGAASSSSVSSTAPARPTAVAQVEKKAKSLEDRPAPAPAPEEDAGYDAVADVGLEDMEAEEVSGAMDDFAEVADESLSRAPRRSSAPAVESVGSTRGGSADPLAESRTLAAPSGALQPAARPVGRLVDAGDWRGARDAAEQALKADGLPAAARADLHYLLGRAHEGLGNTRRALNAYEEAIALRGR